MSLRARLRLAIVAFVTMVVLAVSALYLYAFTQAAFEAASIHTHLLANQVKGYVLERIDAGMAARPVAPGSVAELKAAWTGIVRTDPALTAMLQRTLSYTDVVMNISVVGEDGSILATSNSYVPAPVEDLESLSNGNWFRNLWELETRREDYSTTLPLGIAAQKQPVFKITVVMRSVLLRHALRSAYINLAVAFGLALLISAFLASFVPPLALGPLERVSRNIDLIRTGEFDRQGRPAPRESREFADVQAKLSLLGEQFRGAREESLDLRSNIEHLLLRLEEAVLLFDPSGKLMMAGQGAERLLGKPREEILGRKLDELFPSTTVLGSLVLDAVRRRQAVQDQVVTVSSEGNPDVRLVVSVEVLRKPAGDHDIGTLVTLRDAEGRRQLEVQLDVSSRLAAISRLTGGVAHEIKNPLNAMALHLEVLKDKLEEKQPEIEVISREIKRLDQVVKTFLNFNKPVELHPEPVDLSELLREVAALVSADADAHGVRLETELERPARVGGDADMLKQALLNIVVNAMEAMPGGGRLSLRTKCRGEECSVLISDAGPGIPPEAQEKIFNLYFTTKENGTGIGLATTFRVVQLHSGTIDFVSAAGKGTTFRLRFPKLVEPAMPGTRSRATHI
jgi:signal transduction histidine kinase